MLLSATIQQLCIYIITWNVNTQFPDSKTSVIDLLGLQENHYEQPQQSSTFCSVPDLYVIGLQEVNSKPENLISRFFKDDAWVSKFRQTLAPRDYVAIKVKQMQGLLLVIFSRRQHLMHLRNIETESTKTGFGGFWGNKGAVSIRMDLYGCPTTFLNAHLAAHDDELEKRIHDYNYIVNNHHYHVNQYRYILDHNYIFWFGDLNFRLADPNLKTKQIRNMIQQNRLDELLEIDQLNLVKRENKAFSDFNEEVPTFPPTFKFHLGTSEYNMKRRPAWTDRILHKISVEDNIYSNFTRKIEQISYKSHPEYTISDHKPVIGQFLVNVFDVPAEKFIEFSYISSWRIGEDNLIEYTVSDDYLEQDADWIGIFPKDYSSLNDFLAYEYTNTHAKDNNRRIARIGFTENVNIIEDKDYVLLYFQSSSEHSISSLVGISNAFKAVK